MLKKKEACFALYLKAYQVLMLKCCLNLISYLLKVGKSPILKNKRKGLNSE
jgi:hypothetical protein